MRSAASSAAVTSAAALTGLEVAEALSMEDLVFPRGPGGIDGGAILSKPGEYALIRLGDGQIAYEIGNSPLTAIRTGAHAPERTWTHLAVTYQNGSPGLLAVYQNGILVQAFPSAGTIGDNEPGLDELHIGDGQDPGGDFDEFFHGAIDEVRVWNVARSSEQIAQYAESTLPDSDMPGLIGYWRFDETNSEFALGHSPAAHTALLGSTNTAPGRAYGPNLPGYPIAVPEPGASARVVAVALGLLIVRFERSRRRSARVPAADISRAI